MSSNNVQIDRQEPEGVPPIERVVVDLKMYKMASPNQIHFVEGNGYVQMIINNSNQWTALYSGDLQKLIDSLVELKQQVKYNG